MEKIHCVTVIDGYLSFLVQWKEMDLYSGHHLTKGSQSRPHISEKNANIVRATAMNETFPQEVIQFYESRLQFNENLIPKEQEAEKAAKALLAAKEREAQEARNQQLLIDDEDQVDAASEAIAREERKRDKFYPHLSDLSSSESDSDEELALGSSDDERI